MTSGKSSKKLSQTHSFTEQSSKIENVLVSKVFISAAQATAALPQPSPLNNFVAIWDTGATNTTITQDVVNKCGLQPTGMTVVHHANGQANVNTYLINIGLPNGILVEDVPVNGGKLVGPFDVLIGMDIITLGDFAVTNKNGKTMFSFRYPSIADIDFVEEEKSAAGQVVRPSRKIGRNEPCPCGSGKKYKKCHGANV